MPILSNFPNGKAGCENIIDGEGLSSLKQNVVENENKADGRASVVFGASNTSSNSDQSFIANYDNDIINSMASSAFGALNSINGGFFNFVAGTGNIIPESAFSQTVFGKYNEENNDALFVVGNGENSIDRHNAFTVNSDDSITVGGTTISKDKIASINNLSMSNGDAKDSVIQTVSDSSSDTISHNFKTENLGLGNDGGEWFTSPTEIATLENNGWAFNDGASSYAVSSHSGTGIDPNFGLRIVYTYADPETEYTKTETIGDGDAAVQFEASVFSINVSVPKAGDYVVYTDITSFDLSDSRSPEIKVYINDIALPATIMTKNITELNTPTFFNLGSADFKAGENKVEFVCLTPLVDGSTTPYFNIESITIRGKANSVTGAYSASFGRYNEVIGHHSMAVNYDNKVRSKYSFATGCGNIVEAHTGEAHGSGNCIYSDINDEGEFSNGHVYVSGKGNIVNKCNYVYVGGGRDNVINADLSGAVASFDGTINKNGNYGLISGLGNTISSGYQVAIGAYNEDDDDFIFMVGNGKKDETTGLIDRRNAFSVKRDGSITLGDGSGYATLSVDDVRMVAGKSFVTTIDAENTYATKDELNNFAPYSYSTTEPDEDYILEEGKLLFIYE